MVVGVSGDVVVGISGAGVVCVGAGVVCVGAGDVVWVVFVVRVGAVGVGAGRVPPEVETRVVETGWLAGVEVVRAITTLCLAAGFLGLAEASFASVLVCAADAAVVAAWLEAGTVEELFELPQPARASEPAAALSSASVIDRVAVLTAPPEGIGPVRWRSHRIPPAGRQPGRRPPDAAPQPL